MQTMLSCKSLPHESAGSAIRAAPGACKSQHDSVSCMACCPPLDMADIVPQLYAAIYFYRILLLRAEQEFAEEERCGRSSRAGDLAQASFLVGPWPPDLSG